MTNCEKCGKQIEDGAVFCSACLGGFDTKLSTESEVSATQNGLEHDVFSFKARSSRVVALKRLLPVIVCGSIVIIGLGSIYTDSISSEVPPMILHIGIVVIGLLIVFLITRRSQQDPFLSLSISLLILTLGGGMIVPEYFNLILPIGISLVGSSLVFLLLRHSDRNRPLSLALVVVIVSLGMSLAFPEITTLILAVSFILTGFLLLIGYL
ncbi:MAG: zinc-ribbon domain-containing protein [Candidatus Hodarchaeales archaeon]|jgi:hypothetical protein